ncbi:MAG: hypothetical protein CFH27_01031 [Alphaproteobacteria bacterium MarineAlpha6_Bin5]|nr:MAG: hypothetical protein CFH27_01031 [Alphaproteobacteria bacterium MarineAlpha6_Bin5]|tara:strand:- start:21857 stop:22501 length:645 start_codon:yes stop_codon:yes gene_type:complete
MSEDHNLIKEIEEEVKQDEYKNLWNKYKIYIFISVIFILFTVGSLNFFKYKKEQLAEKQSELFFQATQFIEDEEYSKAKEILKEINKSKNNGYSELSFLYLIDLVEKKKINLDFDDLEVNKNSIFYGLIILQKFNNEINSNIENINNLNEIKDLAKPSSDWSYLANELLSSYYIKKNDFEKAIQSLSFIIDSEDSSEYIKERAKTLVEMIKKNK